MTEKTTKISSLNSPLKFHGLFKMYMHFRTMKIRKKEVKRLTNLQRTLDVLNTQYEHSEDNGEKDKLRIFNVSIFTLTVEYDVSSLKFMILYQTDNWNKQFLSRQLAVLLYESTTDLLELLGKDFRNMIVNLRVENELLQELNEITKELNEFKKENRVVLQEIRNFCGAHRDKNAYKQLKIISQIEPNILLELTGQFMKPVAKLTPFFGRVMETMVKSYNP